MQHVGEPLGGGQSIEHDQQREADRVGEQNFGLRTAADLRGHDCLEHVLVQGLLAPQLA